MNKKGTTFSGWVATALLVTIFIAVLGGVVSDMNILYNEDYPLVLTDVVNGTLENFENNQKSNIEDIQSGEPETSSEGLTLKDSWGILKRTGNALWSFFSGKFVPTITTNYLMLDPVVGTGFRILWVGAIVFSFLAALFRRTT